MKIKIEDIIIWIAIILTIGVALWMLNGSPTESSAIIAVALFVAASELMVWKKIFQIENKTTVGFIRIKNDMEKQNIKINYKLDKIESLLINKKVK